MISKEEIKKLADLARIDVDDDQVEKLRGDMDAILDYLDQVKSIAGGDKEELEVETLHNVMREDADPTPAETHSKVLIAEFPDSEKNYLKVKKIM